MSSSFSDKFQINCGFELQSPDLNLGFIHHDELFCPTEFMTWFLDNKKDFSVYGDSDTGQTQTTKRRLFQHFKDHPPINLVYTSKKDEEFQANIFFHRKNILSFLNDAEFIVTYKNLENIESTELHFILYLVLQSFQAVKKVTNFLSQKTQSFTLTKETSSKQTISSKRFLRSSSGFKTKDWPFKKAFRVKTKFIQEQLETFRRVQGTTLPLGLENMVFYTKDPEYEPETSHFYIQATIGLPLPKVWEIMVIISKMAKKTDFLTDNDLADINYILEINAFYQARLEIKTNDPLLFYLAPLVHYWIHSKENRKSHGFLIRHFMAHLLKLLSKEQLEDLKQLDEFIARHHDLVDTLWREDIFPPNQQRGQEMQLREKRIILKELENIMTSKIFPVHLQGLNTFVLVELRYLNHVLNYLLNPKVKKARLLSLQDLKRILVKLERKLEKTSSLKDKITTSQN